MKLPTFYSSESDEEELNGAFEISKEKSAESQALSGARTFYS